MPKRKNEKSLDYIVKKLKWLEEEIKRRPRRSHYSPSSSSSSVSSSSSSSSGERDVNDYHSATENLEQTINEDILAIPSTSGAQEQPVVEKQSSTDLNPAFLEVLGIDPNSITNYGPEINPELATRLNYVLTSGLKKEERVDFSKKYLIPENCQLIAAPELNAEMKVTFSEISKKRDCAIQWRQKSVATVISCLSHVITSKIINSSDSPDQELLQKLVDATRLLCDVQYNDSVARRNFALSTVKKELQDQLTNTKITKYLFGDSLAETLKVAKAVTKSGTDLKDQSNTGVRHSKNWKSTPGKRRQFPGQSTRHQRSVPSSRTMTRNHPPQKQHASQGSSWNASSHRQRQPRKR